jgi:hypothetical protein
VFALLLSLWSSLISLDEYPDAEAEADAEVDAFLSILAAELNDDDAEVGRAPEADAEARGDAEDGVDDVQDDDTADGVGVGEVLIVDRDGVGLEVAVAVGGL